MANKNVYNSFKVLKHIDRIKISINGEWKPVSLHFDLTNRCNYNCIFCAKNSDGVEIDAAKLIDFLENYKDIKSVLLTGGGEPLMHREFGKIISYLSGKFDIGIITNGALIGKYIDILHDITWMRVSFSATTSKEYAYMHKTNEQNFQLVLDNIKLFKGRYPHTEVGISYVICNNNYMNIVDIYNIAKGSGADNIRYVYDHWMSDAVDINYDIINEQLNTVKSLSTNEFMVYMANVASDTQYKPPLCYMSSIVASVTANGFIYPCAPVRNLPSHRIGSIYDDIEITRTIKPFESKKCSTCICLSNNKNILLERVLGEVNHVNFP